MSDFLRPRRTDKPSPFALQGLGRYAEVELYFVAQAPIPPLLVARGSVKRILCKKVLAGEGLPMWERGRVA